MNFYYSGEKLLIMSQEYFWTPSLDKRWQLIEKRGLVAQTVTRWNQIVSWLQEVDLVRRNGGLRAA